MGRIFTALRAPITLGTPLRGYMFGHVRQLDREPSPTLAKSTCPQDWQTQLERLFDTAPQPTPASAP